MRHRWCPVRRSGLLLAPLLAGALTMGACSIVTSSYSETVTVEAVAGPTLNLFWRLAAVQVEDPAVGRTLLAWDPRGSAEELERLGIEIGAFRDELAEKHGVHAVVLFLNKEEESPGSGLEEGLPGPRPGGVGVPVRAGRRHPGPAPARWSPSRRRFGGRDVAGHGGTADGLPRTASPSGGGAVCG